MNREKFEKLVNEGIGAIPKRFLEKLDNVDICIEGQPSSFQLKKLRAREGSLIFGLYEGIPKTKRVHYGQVLPDKITIFKKPIERVASTPEEIKAIVKRVIRHEIGHHFGFNEKDIRKLEKNW